MPAPAHNKLTIGGVLPGGENFSFGMAFSSHADFGVPILDVTNARQFLNDDTTGSSSWAAGLTAWAGSMGRAAVTCTSLTLSATNAAGLTVLNETRSISAAFGTAGAATMPDQIATVVSWRSDTPGARGRGRVYLPLLGLSIQGDGRLASADTDALATRTLTFLNLVNAKAVPRSSDGMALVIASGQSASGPALYRAVRIGVGRVPDVMRSRRNRLVEAPSTIAIV